MPKSIEAIYENGVFKPLEKIELKEGEKVRLRITRDLRDLVSKFCGVGKYSDKITDDKLYKIEVELLE
ncbi:MAG: antitoxin family protein [Archaeoglobaceae archaeon]